MSEEVCVVLQDLVHLAVRIMPVFVCLEPKYRDRENIIAISVYLWVIMIAADSLFSVEQGVVLIFRGAFFLMLFLVLLIFFQGKLSEKIFLYFSAWLFEVISISFEEFTAYFFRRQELLSHVELCVITSLVMAAGYYTVTRFWMKERLHSLFEQLSARTYALLIVYSTLSCFLLYVETHSILTWESLANRELEDVFFFLIMCVMILTVYFLILSGILGVIERRQTEEELQFARKLINQQREYYNQTLEHIEQVRIIRHDFRHHIHALVHMDREQQTRYLQNLQKELEQNADVIFCQNQAVNGIMQEYASRAEQGKIEFSVNMDLSAHVPIDDLTLCIVIGNLLENAMEACLRMKEGRFIRVKARWMEDHLMMLVENSYTGKIREDGGKILSSKKDGGLGLLSIRRILNQPGDDFDVYFDGNVFTAMVKIVDRTRL
ncbi:sensor histidine kinase [Acetivibrio ethanolgignens]|uniref:Histidine kinase n=1 Tax=Acetivibrio ethanolgignens TaxID=290052 RepID=A0A0V8QBL0_9FIRM|nr:sensor histidine kinase [Acetivibrio ethanolgignens]KSV57953.1 histidine kinase [Acetivibrio ethanolgignens]